jgi:hypothetical protein
MCSLSTRTREKEGRHENCNIDPHVALAGHPVPAGRSPDGTQIAFESDRNGNTDIWVIDLSAVAVEATTRVSDPVEP